MSLLDIEFESWCWLMKCWKFVQNSKSWSAVRICNCINLSKSGVIILLFQGSRLVQSLKLYDEKQNIKKSKPSLLSWKVPLKLSKCLRKNWTLLYHKVWIGNLVHTWTDKIESNLSAPKIQGHQKNALIKNIEISLHLICL